MARLLLIPFLVMIAVLIGTFNVWVGYIIGRSKGRREVEHESAKRGFGTFQVTGKNKIRFQWKSEDELGVSKVPKESSDETDLDTAKAVN